MSVTYKLRMFAVAIVLASVLVGFSFAATSFVIDAETPQVTTSIGLTAAVAAIPIVSVFGLLIAMPIAYLLNAAGVSGYSSWGTAGLLVGVGIFVILAIILSGGSLAEWFLRDILAWSALGALPGLGVGLFWWGAVARPEQLGDGGF